jgi:hypothetical protein
LSQTGQPCAIGEIFRAAGVLRTSRLRHARQLSARSRLLWTLFCPRRSGCDHNCANRRSIKSRTGRSDWRSMLVPSRANRYDCTELDGTGGTTSSTMTLTSFCRSKARSDCHPKPTKHLFESRPPPYRCSSPHGRHAAECPDCAPGYVGGLIPRLGLDRVRASARTINPYTLLSFRFRLKAFVRLQVAD